MRTGIIEWDEIDGAGTLTLAWDDGTRERVEWSEPITSGTDSHEVASQFGAFDAVEHDGRFIHVSRDDK